jgi:hypothetical protein
MVASEFDGNNSKNTKALLAQVGKAGLHPGRLGQGRLPSKKGIELGFSQTAKKLRVYC